MFSFAKKLVDRLEGNIPSLADETYFKGLLHANNNGYALRVLHVQSHSIGRLAGLEAWFDYIVRINNHDLPMKYSMASTPTYGINDDGSISYGGRTVDARAGEIDYDNLAQELAAIATSANKTVTLDVWSAKGGILRQVNLPIDLYTYVANKQHDQVQEIFHDKFKQLGITVQSQHINTATYVWRVLNTHPNSPAFQAQLIPYLDYVIGCDSAFPTDHNGKGLLLQGGEKLLSRTIMDHYNQHFAILGEDNVPITLYVYNHDYDILRPVTVHLSKSWAVGSNRGILGCDVGYGLLHRIPEVVGKFDAKETIDDVLFESKSDYSYKFDERAPGTTNKSFTPSVPLSNPASALVSTTASKPASTSGSLPHVPVSNHVSVPPSLANLMGMVAFEPDLDNTKLSASQAHFPPSRNAEVRTPLIADFLATPPVSTPPVSTPPVAASPIGASNVPLHQTPQAPIQNATFTSASTPPHSAAPRVGVPPSIAPPKIHRKKKHFAASGLGNLTDFMNEELTKSKNSDVKYPNSDTANVPPPPPPPKSAR